MYLNPGIGEGSWYKPGFNWSPSTLPPVGILPPSTRHLWLVIASIVVIKPDLRLWEGAHEAFVHIDGTQIDWSLGVRRRWLHSIEGLVQWAAAWFDRWGCTDRRRTPGSFDRERLWRLCSIRNFHDRLKPRHDGIGMWILWEYICYREVEIQNQFDKIYDIRHLVEW
jgi:hypothetical protein